MSDETLSFAIAILIGGFAVSNQADAVACANDVYRAGMRFWADRRAFRFCPAPNVARELGRAEIPGLKLDPSQLSFVVGRANVKSSSCPGMARWRERLYSALARIATRPTEFFRIPPDRVIELGPEVEI